MKVPKQGCSKREQNESLIRAVQALLYASHSTVLSLSFLSSMQRLIQEEFRQQGVSPKSPSLFIYLKITRSYRNSAKTRVPFTWLLLMTLLYAPQRASRTWKLESEPPLQGILPLG